MKIPKRFQRPKIEEGQTLQRGKVITKRDRHYKEGKSLQRGRDITIKEGQTLQRGTDITIVNRKRTRGQTMMFKTLHRKINVEQHDPQ